MDFIQVAFVFENIATFNHADKVKNFLLKSLLSALRAHNLQGQCAQYDKDSFCLEVKGTKEEVLALSENLKNYIPLSLQWAFKELILIESFSQNPLIPNNAKSGFLTPLESQNICQKDNENFGNLWGEFVDFTQGKITFLQSSKKIPLTQTKVLLESLQKCAQLLKNGEHLFIKTIFGKKEIALLDEEKPLKIQDDYLFMPFCLDSTKLIFKVENEELEALGTLEKPILNLQPKGIFEKFFNNTSVQVILPFEPFLVVLGQFLELGLYLLPLNEKRENGICEFIEESKTPLSISVAKNSLVLPHIFAPYCAIPLIFKDTIATNNLERTNAIYLGKKETQFLIYFDKSFKTPLELAFESNISAILDSFQTLNQTKQSLLKNFTKENVELMQYLESLPKDSKITHNLLDLVALAGILLDFKGNLKEVYTQVIKTAAQFMGQKGPRIDFRLERDTDGKITLNTLQMLSSVMSFKLAGVDLPLLCFGILDSLAEFLANLVRDMEENYQTKGVIISGEAFLNKQFTDQFLHYLPQNSEVFVNSVMDFDSTLF